MKRIIALVFATFWVFSVFALDSCAAGKGVEKVVFTESLTMLKGKTDKVGVKNADKKTKLTFYSTDKSVASVTSSGKITANKCGIATVVGIAEKGKVTVAVRLKVKVIKSHNFLYKAAGKSFAKIAGTAKGIPVFVTGKQLAKGGKSKIKLKNASADDKVSFSSTNSAVAAVDRSGNITAVAPGKAYIVAKVKRGRKTFTFKEIVKVVASDKNTTITDTQRNNYYSRAAFVGSSIGVGQEYYFKSQGSGYLGDPLFLVRKNYAFVNDKRTKTKFIPIYDGVAMRAKDAIKKSGVDKAFINMGINDMYNGPKTAYGNYIEYLKEIREENPKVELFIESTTGVHAKGENKVVNSSRVKELNRLMREYCKDRENIYFIDITSRMLNKNGNLSDDCTTDKYVHLTKKAYAMWMEDVTAYTDKLIIKKQNVEDAVKTAEESKSKTLVKRARKMASNLHASTFKNDMMKRIDAVKAKHR